MLDSQGLVFQAGTPAHRWELPRSLAATRVLLYLMFALTLLGGVGVLNSLLELGSHITPTLTLAALYAMVPGVAAVILARRLWTGGKVVWFALIGLQAWLLVGSVVNLYAGSARGVSQLLLPGVLLALVSVGASRAWFELPAEQRAVRPRWTRERVRRAIPSIPHMIGWRRSRGQSTVEYAGMVGVVALIIGALLLTGVGPQIATGLQTAVCNILGGDCESDTVAGGGGESGGGESDGGGDNGGGDNGGSDGGGDNGGSDGGGSDGGSDGGGDNGGSDNGGSDGGGDNGGSDGGGDNGGSDGGGDNGSDGGGDNGGSDGGSSGGVVCNPVMAPWGMMQSCTETGTGGSDNGGSDNGGSDGGSDNGGSDNGGSDGGGDNGGSDNGGSDGGGDNGGSDNGGSDGGGDNGGSNNGGSDGGGDNGGSDNGGSDGGGDNGGESDGGSDGGGSDGGGSSGGVECNPVMAPWGMMQSCTETGTGGSDNGGGDNGGSDNGGSDNGGSDGGGDNGGSDNGGSDGGGDSGGGSDGGGDSGGGDSGGESDGGSDGGGSDGGGSSGGVVCNPVMAPWGMMQSCTETGTGGSDNGGGDNGGSSGGQDDDNKDDDKDDEDKDDEDKDDEDKDEDEDDNDEDKKPDCRDTNVAYVGPVTTGSAGDGRYTLASAGTRNSVVYSGSGSLLLAAPGDPSPADMAMSISASSMAGVDTYQDIENQISNALGLTDPPPPPVQDDTKPKPPVKPKPPHLQGCPVKTPMNVLDDVPKYSEYDRKTWSEKVEEEARKHELTKDFTKEDALIIADYTGSWAEDANKYLRGQGIPGSRKNSVPKFIEKMDTALDHLPPVKGTFHRGTFMPDELLERFANGEEVEMPEYLSTSSDPAKADRAAQNAKANGRSGENVVMEITTDNGRNIDPLSRYEGKESEVLIPRGGKFVKTGETTKIIGGKEYKVIQVKQVP
ncbi:ADP-ribosyltransferase [Streptomyces camponoticapitis]|uniref:ADP-ribosyltransferase n=1 Tax=Streptomyces camponoticapitis TaxID=1616125 RepID=UPI00166E9610|nr:ADP-ribosyltransferase [Streptomyces camponoticapitis]